MQRRSAESSPPSATAGRGEPRALPLRRWLWRSYLKTTLYPLLLVELVIVGIFIWTTNAAHRENTAALRRITTAELAGIARREAHNISERLAGVGRTTALFRDQVGAFLARPPLPSREMLDEVAEGPGGMLYTPRDRGLGAVYAGGRARPDESARNLAAASETLGPLMRDVKASDDLIVQVYFNTPDAVNRLYPWYDVPSTIDPGFDVTRENFYYLADATHNPARRVKWIDAYLDPAGAGWVVSCIAPIYREDALAGTVGIDITLNTIVAEVMKLDIPWQGYGVLLDDQGNLIALPPVGERDFGASARAGGGYRAALRAGESGSDGFNVHRREAMAPLARLLGERPAGVGDAELGGRRVVGWASVPETGWKLLVIVRTAGIFADAQRWRDEVSRVTAWMVGGIVGFYALFFTFLALRARVESQRLSRPLLRLNEVMRAIASGDYRHAIASSRIAELDETAALLVDTGEQMARKVEALRQSEDDLREARNEAIAANDAKSMFLAHMSHEIRTPLNGVLGMVELVRGRVSDAETRSRLDTALLSARHLVRIIDDILDFSKIEAGRLRLEHAPFELRALLVELGALYSASAQSKGLALRVDLQPDAALWLRGDATRLQQVLSNLVSNAIKFTHSGEVVIGARARAGVDGWTDIECAVTDTGIGMSQHALAKIFQPFAQADDSITRRFGGTGLGLSICNRLVQLMGGEGITVESAVDQGSSFAFRLRLEVAEPPREAPPGPVGPPPDADRSARCRILVAEDNPVNQMVVEAMLKQAGHEVTLAGDGREAVGAYAPGRFDLALIDIHMPELDGYAVARAIRERERENGTHLPLVALTASAFQEDRERAAAAGMEELVPKPVDLVTLLAVVARHAAGRGEGAAPASAGTGP